MRARTGLVAAALVAALVACNDSGALVTVTLAPTEAVGVDRFDGQFFVASVGSTTPDVRPGDAFVDLARADLERGYVVHLEPGAAPADRYVVAVALWPHGLTDDELGSTAVWWGHLDDAQIRGDALRSYALPLARAATTHRRPGCPADVEPAAAADPAAPADATVWFGGWRDAASPGRRCIGWLDEVGAPVELGGTSDDPDCDGTAPAPGCAQGAHQCWSDVLDAPAEDFDGDGVVADQATGAGLVIDGAACVACADVGCECAPADGEVHLGAQSEQCDAADVTCDPSYVPDRRCVALGDAGCQGGIYRCDGQCATPGMVQSAVGCEEPSGTPMLVHCGASDCDLGGNEPAKIAAITCPRPRSEDVGCGWLSKLTAAPPADALVRLLAAGATCHDAALWGGHASGVALVKLSDAGPEAIMPGEAVPCRSLALQQAPGFVADEDAMVLLTAKVELQAVTRPELLPIALTRGESVDSGCPIETIAIECGVP